MTQQRTRRTVAAEGMPIDADPRQVHARITYGKRADRRDVIVQLQIGRAQEAGIVESL